MSHSWISRHERGNKFWLHVICWIARAIGRPFARALLYPITLYFFSTSPSTRRASREFLGQVLTKTPSLVDVFKHHLVFSSTILDRTYLLTGREDLLNITIYNEEVLLSLVASGQGCLLLGAHLGSFEVLRALSLQNTFVLKVLMYHDHGETISHFLDLLNPELSDTVIPMGRRDTVFRVMECVKKGHVVGMLGDRYVKQDKTIQCYFLGKNAQFPTGPAALAVALQIPVIVFYGTYHGGNCYEIDFELLTDALKPAREERKEMIQDLTRRYVRSLENRVKQVPYNWFNFYAFWEDS